MVGDSDEPYYWSLDFPGMTSAQASRVASAVEESGLGLQVVPVDPAVFLTLNIDRDTVEALMAGLSEAPSNPILEAMQESFAEWLEWLDQSER